MTCEIILGKKCYLPSIFCLPAQHPSGKVFLLCWPTGKGIRPRDEETCPVAVPVRGELNVYTQTPAPSTNPLSESRVDLPSHDIDM